MTEKDLLLFRAAILLREIEHQISIKTLEIQHLYKLRKMLKGEEDAS